jgi:tRNA (guanine-N7-)-methyltransferase
MVKAPPPPLRIRPTDWLGPLDVAGGFTRPPARIEADVGCGKGRFLLARAASHPDTSFLGIDRMLGRLQKIEAAAFRLGVDNIRLLRCDAAYAITYLLPDRVLDAMHVYFPDPWPKERHHGNRLFSPSFLDALIRVLKPGACVHVATDHLPYFDEIREGMDKNPRFESTPAFIPEADERTDFELRFLGVTPIGRGSWRLLDPPAPIPGFLAPADRG